MAVYSTFTGRLVHDPEMKYSGSGVEYLPLTLYTNEWDSKDKAAFTGKVRVTVFGQQAERLNKVARKGCILMCQGQIELSPTTGGVPTYNKADGTLVASLSMRAFTCDIVSWPPDGEDTNEEKSESE